jgi:hypothetical protein
LSGTHVEVETNVDSYELGKDDNEKPGSNECNQEKIVKSKDEKRMENGKMKWETKWKTQTEGRNEEAL